MRQGKSREKDCDVLVIGGGIAGFAAALAAAREGADTLLLEARPFVGGNATTGLCLHSYITRNGRQVVHGIAQELVERLIEAGGAVGHIPYGGFVHSVTPVDGDRMRVVATKMLAEAGVRVLFGATVVGIEREGEWVSGLQVALKGGVRTLRAAGYVDASGDADVAALAGARFRLGQEGTGKMQPVSMLLHFHNVDTRAIADALSERKPAMAGRPEHPEPFPVYFNGHFGKWNALIREQGLFPHDDHMVFFNTVWPDQINVNTSAVVGVDGTDPFALSRATVQLTDQVSRIAEFLIANVPGFARGYYVPAVFAGVRETRNIEGLYTISEADIRAGRKFDDSIGQACFPVDIHDPDTAQATFDPIGDDGAYDLPYRALVPAGVENVIVVGRCISATHYAHGATRNMAPGLVTGQAGGAAAAMAARAGIGFPQLHAAGLQERLEAAGVYLGQLAGVAPRAT
jgi:hypothetical protein